MTKTSVGLLATAEIEGAVFCAAVLPISLREVDFALNCGGRRLAKATCLARRVSKVVSTAASSGRRGLGLIIIGGRLVHCKGCEAVTEKRSCKSGRDKLLIAICGHASRSLDSHALVVAVVVCSLHSTPALFRQTLSSTSKEMVTHRLRGNIQDLHPKKIGQSLELLMVFRASS